MELEKKKEEIDKLESELIESYSGMVKDWHKGMGPLAEDLGNALIISFKGKLELYKQKLITLGIMENMS